MSTNTTEVVLAADDAVQSSKEIIQGFAEQTGAVYSTISTDKFSDKLAVLNATNNALPLNENYGVVINLRNFVLQAIIVQGEDGPVEAIRSILIDESGTAYASVATGVRMALENICGVAGHPDQWESAIPVVADEVKTRKGFKVVQLSIAA